MKELIILLTSYVIVMIITIILYCITLSLFQAAMIVTIIVPVVIYVSNVTIEAILR